MSGYYERRRPRAGWLTSRLRKAEERRIARAYGTLPRYVRFTDRGSRHPCVHIQLPPLVLPGRIDKIMIDVAVST